jgi:hydrogenase 3 maturation protease
VKRPQVPDLETVLGKRLSGARRVAIVGIGDELSRHDRLGILAARDFEALRLPAVKVFLAGTIPESFTGPIRRWKPDHVVLIDAADMGTRPGTVAVIGAQNIRGSRLSTHALPLSLVIKYLEKDVGTRVTLVGIQPDLAASGPTTGAETAGVTHLVASLHRLLGGRKA